MTRYGRVGVIAFAIVIALASWMISYSTQVGVVLRHGFGAAQAAGWPVCTEAAALAIMLLLVMGEVRSGVPTVAAWTLVFACLAATTWINWLSDPGDLVGAGLHSWTPVLSVAVFLLLVHGRPPRVHDEPVNEPVPEPVDEPAPEPVKAEQEVRPVAPEPVQREVRPVAHASARRRLVRLLADRPGLGPTEAAQKLGVSRSTAKRWLAEARTPRVVEQSAR